MNFKIEDVLNDTVDGIAKMVLEDMISEVLETENMEIVVEE